MLIDILLKEDKPVNLNELYEMHIEILDLNEEISLSEISAYLNESVSLQEGLSDSIKAFFDKIIEFGRRVKKFILEQIAKIKNKLRTFFANDDEIEAEIVDPVLFEQSVDTLYRVEKMLSSLDPEDAKAVAALDVEIKALNIANKKVEESKAVRKISKDALARLNAKIEGLAEVQERVNTLMENYRNLSVKTEQQETQKEQSFSTKLKLKITATLRKLGSITSTFSKGVSFYIKIWVLCVSVLGLIGSRSMSTRSHYGRMNISSGFRPI